MITLPQPAQAIFHFTSQRFGSVLAVWLALGAILCGCSTATRPPAVAPPKLPALAAAKAKPVPVAISTNITWAWFDTNNVPPTGSYRLYWGPAQGNYTNFVAGPTTNASVTITSGTYLFAATALSPTGKESTKSSGVLYNLPFQPSKPGH